MLVAINCIYCFFIFKHLCFEQKFLETFMILGYSFVKKLDSGQLLSSSFRSFNATPRDECLFRSWSFYIFREDQMPQKNPNIASEARLVAMMLLRICRGSKVLHASTLKANGYALGLMLSHNI